MLEPLFLNFQPDAFVFKNWKLEVVKDNRPKGQAVLLSSQFGSWSQGSSTVNLAQFSGKGAVDASGIFLTINDGLGCQYTGEYLPCLWGSSDDRSKQCMIKTPNDSSPEQSFASLNWGSGPCGSWQMEQSLACENIGSDDECADQFVFPHGQSGADQGSVMI